MIRTELLGDDDVTAVRSDWSALAKSCARPFCEPAWMLGWWKHVAPAGARLAVISVRDGDRLIGLAPLFFKPQERGPLRFRSLGVGTFLRAEPLSQKGREAEVAEAIASGSREIARQPGLFSFEGVPTSSAWPELLRGAWTVDKPSRLFVEWAIPAPVLSLHGRTFDEWFSEKSSNFRQQMRRGRRKLEGSGARFRMSTTVDELERDLKAFSTLHHARWDERGGSQALTPEVEKMLSDAGRAMLSDGGFRLWSLEIGDQIVSSHLLLAAGGEVSYWLGGFDERWSASKPSMQVLLAAIEHAWKNGDSRVDLGGGGQDYKYRFTDDREMLRWCTVVPSGLRSQATRVALSTVRMRRKLVARLGPGTQARVRRLFRR